MSHDENPLAFYLLKYADYAYWKKWYAANKEKFNATVNKHKQNRRKEFQKLIDEKKDIPCLHCGKSFPPAAMDLVHRDGEEKKFSLSNATRLIYSLDKLQEELNKCDVYCANCVKTLKTEQFLEDSSDTSTRERRRKKLKGIVDSIKDTVCSECGEKFPPYVMELDHVDPSKKTDSISKMITKEKPLEKILDELGQTRVICTNCHRIHTYNQRHPAELEEEE